MLHCFAAYSSVSVKSLLGLHTSVKWESMLSVSEVRTDKKGPDFERSGLIVTDHDGHLLFT